MRSQLPPKRGTAPSFRFMSIVAKLLDGGRVEDATWYGSRPRPRPHCIRRDPSSPPKGHSSPPIFGSCLLWPRSPISATAELLLIITSLPHAMNCGRFCFWRRQSVFCVSNISGTAEHICAKLTGKTCLVPRYDEFEGQGQRSKVKVTRDKNGIFSPFGGLRAFYVL